MHVLVTPTVFSFVLKFTIAINKNVPAEKNAPLDAPVKTVTIVSNAKKIIVEILRKIKIWRRYIDIWQKLFHSISSPSHLHTDPFSLINELNIRTTPSRLRQSLLSTHPSVPEPPQFNTTLSFTTPSVQHQKPLSSTYSGFFGVLLRGVLNWKMCWTKGCVELSDFGGWKGVTLLCWTEGGDPSISYLWT